MNRKQLLILVALCVVVGGIGVSIARRNVASYQSSSPTLGKKLLPDFPLNDVALIAIREGTNQIDLVFKDSTWQVKERDGYPARYEDVAGLLRKMWELKSVRSEEVGASQLPRLNLVEPGPGTNTGTRVEFKDANGKLLASVLLGKQHMQKGGGGGGFPGMGGSDGFPNGRYILVSGSKSVGLVSDPFSELQGRADRWLNRDFLKVEKLKSISVNQAEATNSWRVYREKEGGELKLADPKEGETLDSGKSSSIGNAFSYASFEDVRPPQAKPEETGLDHPLTATVETFDGFTYTVKAGNPAGGEKYYLTVAVAADLPKERKPDADEKPEDKERKDKEFKEKLAKLEEKLKNEKAFENWIYQVSKWSIDPLLKLRKDLLTEAKPAGNTNAPPTTLTPSIPGSSLVPSAPADEADEKETGDADGAAAK
jgi:hypothetical protein